MNQKDEIIQHCQNKGYNYHYCEDSSIVVNKLFVSHDKDPEYNSDVEISIDKNTFEIISMRYEKGFGEQGGGFIYDITTAKRLLSRYMTQTKG